MSDYTAKDFAAAQFAIEPNKDNGVGRYWTRRGPGGISWGNGLGTLRSDRQMAAMGCIPVYAEPYSPEALKRACKHGEMPVPGEVATEGMVTIACAGAPHPRLYVNSEGGMIGMHHRIVYRPPAPEPDPVADLTAVLTDWYDRPLIRRDQLAELLRKHGMRVVTDDE